MLSLNKIIATNLNGFFKKKSMRPHQILHEFEKIRICESIKACIYTWTQI